MLAALYLHAAKRSFRSIRPLEAPDGVRASTGGASAAGAAGANLHTFRGHGSSYRLLAHAEAETYFHKCQPALIEHHGLWHLFLAESSSSHGHRPSDEMPDHSAVVDPESFGELPRRHAALVERHQLVDLSRIQKGLSHSN
ncbi:hypothetical protein [Sinomonas sp. P47F7]|uniref:hypothetical protein n=1 Tax=Sinomonas sp. P47F7 TaxID=3410987 RepID=UPI003BF532D2